MTDLPPSRTARLVVGALASMALLVGVYVLALVTFLALYLGASRWAVAAGLAACVVGLAAAFQRVRRAASRH